MGCKPWKCIAARLVKQFDLYHSHSLGLAWVYVTAPLEQVSWLRPQAEEERNRLDFGSGQPQNKSSTWQFCVKYTQDQQHILHVFVHFKKPLTKLGLVHYVAPW